jgi:hypothetical protein
MVAVATLRPVTVAISDGLSCFGQSVGGEALVGSRTPFVAHTNTGVCALHGPTPMAPRAALYQFRLVF